MAFPTDLDNFNDPTSANTLNSPDHATLHQLINAAVEALEAKVGVDSSAVATSHTYLLRHLPTQEADITLGNNLSVIGKETGGTSRSILLVNSSNIAAVGSTSLQLLLRATSVDLNGVELILDADADTSITADTDNQIDIKINNADDFRFTANNFTALAGSSINTDTIAETTSAAGVTIDGMLVKDSKLATNDSVVTTNITDEAVTSRKVAPTIISEQSTADVNTITSEVDITGCTTTFTPAIASSAIVWGVFYFNSGSNANDIFYGSLNVDGSNEAELVRYVVPTSGGGGTFAQVWVVGLTAASHTLKLRAGRTSGTGSCSVRQVHTKLLVWLVGNDNVTDS